MNEDNIQNFIRQTEEYLRMNQPYLCDTDLARLVESFNELNDELARQKLFNELDS